MSYVRKHKIDSTLFIYRHPSVSKGLKLQRRLKFLNETAQQKTFKTTSLKHNVYNL